MRNGLIAVAVVAAALAAYLLTRGSSTNPPAPAAAEPAEAPTPSSTGSTYERRTPPTLPAVPEAPEFRRMGGRGDGDGRRQGWRGERRAERIRRFDANGDGQLDEQERNAMRAARSERRRDRNLEYFDSDGDGALDDDEQTMLKTARADMASDRAARMVQRLDADQDGRISRDEAAAGGRRMQRIMRDFDEVDADSDGSIDEKELQRAIMERRQRRGPRDGEGGGDGDAPPAR